MTQHLMWEMSKIQETLCSMNEELKGLREVKESVRKLREAKDKEDEQNHATSSHIRAHSHD